MRNTVLICVTILVAAGLISYHVAPTEVVKEVELCTPNVVDEWKYKEAVKYAYKNGLATPNEPIAREAIRELLAEGK